MNRTAKTAQLERTIQLMLLGLRKWDGTMPMVTRGNWRMAARLLRLRAFPGDWRAEKPFEPYLEACGFDQEGRIIDYERFYAALEAHGVKL